MNARISPTLRDEVKAAAKRKGLTLDKYISRVLAAAVQSEGMSHKPGFLEAWEKFLAQYRSKK